MSFRKLRRYRKRAVKTFLKWKNKNLDLLAYFMIRCLRKLNIKVPNIAEKSFFGSRIKLYSENFRLERIKPKKFRAKTRLREDFVKKGLAPDPKNTLERIGSLSQHNEHQILLNLVKELNLNDSEKVSIEIGSGHQGGNSGVLTFSEGFRSLWIDGDDVLCAIARKSYANCDLVVLNDWITRENVLNLIDEYGFSKPSYVGIDIDGNDFWIFREVLKLSPKIIAVEYNPVFGFEASLSIKYNPRFNRKAKNNRGEWEVPKGIHGASIMAFCRQALESDFRLVAASNPGSNLFFIQKDLLQEIPDLPPSVAFQVPRKQNLKKILNKQLKVGFDHWLLQHAEWLQDPLSK